MEDGFHGCSLLHLGLHLGFTWVPPTYKSVRGWRRATQAWLRRSVM